MSAVDEDLRHGAGAAGALGHRGATGGVAVERHSLILPYGDVAEPLVRALDHKLGCFFSSSVEFPGRYSRWAFGFAEPPVEVVGHERRLVLRALNGRGEALVARADEAVYTAKSSGRNQVRMVEMAVA